MTWTWKDSCIWIGSAVAIVLGAVVAPYPERRMWFVRYFWGLKLPEATEDSTDGSALVASAFFFVITQAYTLTIVLREQQAPPVDAYWGYGLTSLATAGAVVGIMRATCFDKSGTRRIRRFDEGTQMAARWTWVWSIIIPIAFSILAARNGLPGMEEPVKIPLPFRDVVRHEFPDGEHRQGIRITVPITPGQFRRGTPDRLSIDISFDEDVNKQLRLVGATLFVGQTDVTNDPSEVDKTHPRSVTFDPYPSTTSGREAARFDLGLREMGPKTTYLLVLRLRRRYEGVNIMEVISLIKERKDKAVSIYGIPSANPEQ